MLTILYYQLTYRTANFSYILYNLVGGLENGIQRKDGFDSQREINSKKICILNLSRIERIYNIMTQFKKKYIHILDTKYR